MKTLFIRDLWSSAPDNEITLHCWVKTRRNLGQIIFLDLVDSTGAIQAVVNKNSNGAFEEARQIPMESAVCVKGVLQSIDGPTELLVNSLEVVGRASANFSPRPHSDLDIFDVSMTDHLLRNRHLYIRNEKTAAILRYRHIMMQGVRDWFNKKGFTEITAPVLTALPLYEDGSAMSLDIKGQKAFLTQCVGFYLEAAVHSFERVYNMGPSFRAEESRSKRHLMEYWHIKGEIAWVNRDDIIALVEDMIAHIIRFSLELCGDIIKTLGTTFCTDGLAIPYPRISYAEAIKKLNSKGFLFEFGSSLGSEEEAVLSKEFITPFWVVGIPRTIEPFPYVIDKEDPRVTMTADLICSRGYGELLGVAEKINNLAELDERMQEKGKAEDPRYEWLRQMRNYGCVPHGGFGMGVERCIRWLLNIPHVRDAMPFPRIFRRDIMP